MESWERVNKQLPFSFCLFPPRPSSSWIKAAAEKKWNSNLAAARRLNWRNEKEKKRRRRPGLEISFTLIRPQPPPVMGGKEHRTDIPFWTTEKSPFYMEHISKKSPACDYPSFIQAQICPVRKQNTPLPPKKIIKNFSQEPWSAPYKYSVLSVPHGAIFL